MRVGLALIWDCGAADMAMPRPETRDMRSRVCFRPKPRRLCDAVCGARERRRAARVLTAQQCLGLGSQCCALPGPWPATSRAAACVAPCLKLSKVELQHTKSLYRCATDAPTLDPPCRFSPSENGLPARRVCWRDARETGSLAALAAAAATLHHRSVLTAGGLLRWLYSQCTCALGALHGALCQEAKCSVLDQRLTIKS